MIHTVYFLLLDRAYRSGGDLSIVYPLARATGPLLTIVVAMLAARASGPGPTAIVGAVLIGASALLLTGNPFAWHKSDARQAVGFALLTGFTIACYTIFDKSSVAAWLIPPLVYDWGCNFCRVHGAAADDAPPRAGRHGEGVARAARNRGRDRAALAAFLHPGAHRDGVHAGEPGGARRARSRSSSPPSWARISCKEGDLTRRVIAAVGHGAGNRGV